MRDISYRELPLGLAAVDYLQLKRKRLTAASERGYEACLAAFATFYPAHVLADFEPPAGTALLERFLAELWGERSPKTYNKNLSIIHDFFEWQLRRGRMVVDPTLPVERARARAFHRTTFTAEQRSAVLRANPDPRDRVPLRLLLDYGIRKGALQTIRFQDFNHAQRRLVVFTKGEKVHQIPLVDDGFWADLDHLITEIGAQPHHYLLPAQKLRKRRPPEIRLLQRLELELAAARESATAIANTSGSREATRLLSSLGETDEWLTLARKQASISIRRFPDRPIGDHGGHDWWYRCLERAGVVAAGVTRGERMHKARHTAGQRVLDKTGNLKAVQMLLGHSSIRTTADSYLSWEIDQLEATMKEVVG